MAVKGVDLIILIVGLAVWLMGALFAAWLSWKSNTVLGFSIPLKVIFMVFAFLSSWGYVIGWVMYKWGFLRYITSSPTGGLLASSASAPVSQPVAVTNPTATP